MAMDGKLYVAGGGDGIGTYFSSVERYDPATNVWEAVAAMGTERVGHCAAVLDGKLYVAGGKDIYTDNLSSADSVERYDPATNAWELVAAMSGVRSALAATLSMVVLDEKLYAAGNRNGEPLNSKERYDPATNTWEVLAMEYPFTNGNVFVVAL